MYTMQTGGNPGGYYEGSATDTSPWVGMNLGGLDITTTYGNDLSASIDVKWSGPSAGIGWEIYGNSGGNRWMYDFLMVPPSVWTNYALTIDTTWTDGEANTAGWVTSGGTGTFASVWTSVDFLLFTQRQAGGPLGTWTASVDNFILTPEPATLVVLLSGLGLALLGRRRK